MIISANGGPVRATNLNGPLDLGGRGVAGGGNGGSGRDTGGAGGEGGKTSNRGIGGTAGDAGSPPLGGGGNGGNGQPGRDGDDGDDGAASSSNGGAAGYGNPGSGGGPNLPGAPGEGGAGGSGQNFVGVGGVGGNNGFPGLRGSDGTGGGDGFDGEDGAPGTYSNPNGLLIAGGGGGSGTGGSGGGGGGSGGGGSGGGGGGGSAAGLFESGIDGGRGGSGASGATGGDGADGGDGGSGGAGGGAIEIVVTGTLTISGQLSADGSDGSAGSPAGDPEAAVVGSAGSDGSTTDASTGGTGGGGGSSGAGGAGGTGGDGAGGAGGTIIVQAETILLPSNDLSSHFSVSGGSGGGDAGDGDNGAFFIRIDSDLAGTGVSGAIPLSSSPSNQRIDIPGDEDWFIFTLSEDSTGLFYTEGDSDTIGNLLAADGATVLSANDDQGDGTLNFRVSQNLPAGTYYLRIRGFQNRTGPYTLIHQIQSGFQAPAVELSNNTLRWNNKSGISTRVIQSADLRQWTYLNDTIYQAEGGLAQQFVETLPPSKNFFRVVQGDRTAFAASLQSSSNDAGSGGIRASTTGFQSESGDPARFGNTPFTVNGSPLTQASSTTAVSAGLTVSNFRIIAQAPGELSSSLPANFPQGTYLKATVAQPPFNLVSGSPYGLVNFPYDAGWIGAQASSGGTFFSSSNLPPSSVSFNSTLQTYAIDLQSEGITPSNGALFVTSTSNTGAPLVASSRAGSIGWSCALFHPETSNATASTFSFSFVPFDTPGIAIGQINQDGSVENGSDNFTISWDANRSLYVLQLTDLAPSDGALIISSAQSSTSLPFIQAAHFQWRRAGNTIEILSHQLPLTGNTLVQNGFSFAFFPFDRLIVPGGR